MTPTRERRRSRAMLKFVKFTELAVVDQDRALSFYTEKLGLHVAQEAS